MNQSFFPSFVAAKRLGPALDGSEFLWLRKMKLPETTDAIVDKSMLGVGLCDSDQRARGIPELPREWSRLESFTLEFFSCTEFYVRLATAHLGY